MHESQNSTAPPEEVEDRWHTTKEVGTIFGVSGETIRNWIAAGHLRSKIIAGRHRIPHSEVKRLANHRFGSDGSAGD